MKAPAFFGSFASFFSSIAAKLPRRMRMYAIAGAGLAALVLAVLVAAGAKDGPDARINERMEGPAIFYNTETVRSLVLPGPAPGQPPFPLAFERKSRYTEEDIARNAPEYRELDLEALERDRKAELDTLLQSVD